MHRYLIKIERLPYYFFLFVLKGGTVNISDEAPTSIYELLKLIGETMESSSEPLVNPWHLQIDSSFARSLGFQPVVRTVYQAKQEDLL